MVLRFVVIAGSIPIAQSALPVLFPRIRIDCFPELARALLAAYLHRISAHTYFNNLNTQLTIASRTRSHGHNSISLKIRYQSENNESRIDIQKVQPLSESLAMCWWCKPRI